MLLTLAIIFGLVPGFAWLFFFLREDPHPEPPRLIAYVFIIGGLVTFIAISIEKLYTGVFRAALLDSPSLSAPSGFHLELFLLFLGLAAIEETAKFVAAYFSIHQSKYFDEAVDAMIYCIVAALGFATVENILFALGGIREGLTAGLISTDVIGGVAQTISLRFVGATLLHGLGSGLVGYAWALGIVRGREWHYIGGGLALATLLHTAFNYFIIKYGDVQIIYPSLLLIVAAVFVLYDFEKIKGYSRTQV